MKLIIAGSRTFSDYQRLCQGLAPDRQHLTQAITVVIRTDTTA